MTERKYLPTFAELVDRLTICQLKAIHIPDKREQYMQEMADIEHDLDLLIAQAFNAGWFLRATDARAVAAIMLTNYAIWINESATRNGDDTADAATQLKRLRLTHSLNGQRNAAKNRLAASFGERQDAKIDCFAADLVRDFGQWQLFE